MENMEQAYERLWETYVAWCKVGGIRPKYKDFMRWYEEEYEEK